MLLNALFPTRDIGTDPTKIRDWAQAAEDLGFHGLEVKSSTPQELAKLLKESYDRWGPIVKKIGFTADS